MDLQARFYDVEFLQSVLLTTQHSDDAHEHSPQLVENYVSTKKARNQEEQTRRTMGLGVSICVMMVLATTDDITKK